MTALSDAEELQEQPRNDDPNFSVDPGEEPGTVNVPYEPPSAPETIIREPDGSEGRTWDMPEGPDHAPENEPPEPEPPEEAP